MNRVEKQLLTVNSVNPCCSSALDISSRPSTLSQEEIGEAHHQNALEEVKKIEEPA